MERTRSTAIIIKNKQILLIHRKKDGLEYWVFPGGGIEEGETGETAVIREVLEETSLTAKNPRLAFMDFNNGGTHPFYFVEVLDGEVKLGGPEASKISADNWYNPEWVDLDKIKSLNLLPLSAKEKLLALLELK